MIIKAKFKYIKCTFISDKNSSGVDSVYQTNRYNLTPTKSLSYNIQATYSEPIFKTMFCNLAINLLITITKVIGKLLISVI